MFYFQDFRCTIRLCVDFEHLSSEWLNLLVSFCRVTILLELYRENWQGGNIYILFKCTLNPRCTTFLCSPSKNCLTLNQLYSPGSNSESSKTKSIQKPNILKFGFQTVRFSNGRIYSYRHLWNQPFENRTMASLGCFIHMKKCM